MKPTVSILYYVLCNISSWGAGMSRPQCPAKRPLRFDDEGHGASDRLVRGGYPVSKRCNRDGVRDGGRSEMGRVGADRSRHAAVVSPGDNGIKARTFVVVPTAPRHLFFHYRTFVVDCDFGQCQLLGQPMWGCRALDMYMSTVLKNTLVT